MDKKTYFVINPSILIWIFFGLGFICFITPTQFLEFMPLKWILDELSQLIPKLKIEANIMDFYVGPNWGRAYLLSALLALLALASTFSYVIYFAKSSVSLADQLSYENARKKVIISGLLTILLLWLFWFYADYARWHIHAPKTPFHSAFYIFWLPIGSYLIEQCFEHTLWGMMQIYSHTNAKRN